jgi:membrane protein
MMNSKKILDLLKESITGWSRHEASLHAAALAYYTIFSLAPLLIISVGIASLVFNQAAVEGLIVETIEDFVGTEVAILVQDIILNSTDVNSSSLAAGIGILVMLYGASIVFFRLQRSLNAMWDIVPRTENVHQGIIAIIRNGLLSAGAALAVGFYLLVLLILNTLWTTIPQQYLQKFFSGSEIIVPFVSFLFAPIMYMIPFAIIYKGLPKATVKWRDVWPGAAIAAVLFWIGGHLIGLYLYRSGVTSVFGAAGSLVAFLIWIFYSAMVFLFGAKFTQVYATMYGSPIVPAENAMFRNID